MVDGHIVRLSLWLHKLYMCAFFFIVPSLGIDVTCLLMKFSVLFVKKKIAYDGTVFGVKVGHVTNLHYFCKGKELLNKVSLFFFGGGRSVGLLQNNKLLDYCIVQKMVGYI